MAFEAMAANDTTHEPTSSHDHIAREEERLLQRVLDHLEERRATIPALHSYDTELVSLRDQIFEARLEDVPALLAQMERLAGIGAQRNELRAGLVDPSNPYFAHLELRETDRNGTRERGVLIGKTTYIDASANVRIVDWRHAPVSQLYYRYGEGEAYEETFGDREVEGEVLVRRTLTIHKGKLHRVASPQGTFVRREDGSFRVIAPRSADLAGGQGKATRPGEAKTRGALGVGPDGEQRADRHLPEISALLDPRQFELISRTDAGIVVIQGGAGSGKTTIGLHRLAFLNYQGPKKFSGDRMMVMTTSKGLVSYTSEVLPALGVHGVNVATFPEWADKQRRVHFPWLATVHLTDETPPVVSSLKKHPGVLRALENRAREALDDPKLRMDPLAPVSLWAELLTDLEALRAAMAASDAPSLTDSELRRAHRWCSDRCPAVADLRPGEPVPSARAPQDEDDDDIRGDVGIDGLPTHEDHLTLDVEDAALLLRAYQILRGSLRKGKDRLEFEHLFVDEAQDFAPSELAVLVDVTTRRRSITLAGDTSQRLVMDNAFRGWEAVFRDLGINAISIEPLKIAYRSTREILELARDLLGPMADALPAMAPRTGAPVEMFITPGPGVAVAQLAEALRALALREPRATVAVLARFADQADIYYEGLRRAEVPNLRRVHEQDFVFRPGVDVTEVREVKGLEYDYVVLVDVNASTFPADMESRHLLHVGATRAAHQLWIVATGPESRILPGWLVDEAL
jgi:DNA helicase-2/ATP-dependent DNA helicase PcrA